MMHLWMDWYLFVSLVVAVPYVLLISFFTVGWMRNDCAASDGKYYPRVSVVIAFRNEASNLPALLQCLSLQKYPKEKTDIIFSDDFSVDDGPAIVSKFIADKPALRLLKPGPGEATGKKAALQRAILAAEGEIILTADADCMMEPEWIHSMVSGFENRQTLMMLGPVVMDYGLHDWFGKLQTLEFMSIMGVTGGAAAFHVPVMANGANLAFRKTHWLQVKNEVKGSRTASGDDMFLMHAFKKRFGGKAICFNHQAKSQVRTHVCEDLYSFMKQRKRWAAKSVHYSDGFTLFTGAIVALMNLFLSVAAIAIIFYPGLLFYLLLVFLLKALADLPLLLVVSRSFKKISLMWTYPVLALLYPFYVSLTLILSSAGKVGWKNN